MTELVESGKSKESVPSGQQSDSTRQPDVDPAWLSQTIGAIYDCAIQPENWRSTIVAICRDLGFANGLMDIMQLGPGTTNSIQFNAGVDADFTERFGGYVDDSLDMWGGRLLIENWPLEEPAVASKIIPLERKLKNRYYIDILGPRGFTDGAIVPLARGPSLLCYLGLNRHFSAGDVTDEVITALRLLSPHMRRAVTIGNLLDLQTVERATFESVLSAMSCGVVLVGGDLGVVHANPAASAILSEGGLLAERNGRLIARGPHAQSSLEDAVRLAADDETKISRRGIGVPAQSVDGRAAVLNVMPLTGGSIRPGLHQRAVAAVFIASPERSAHVPVDAISLLYDFTPAEAQIFASLAKGCSLDQTAEALGVAKSTARTHLLRLFDKTGCKRQAELVALAARHALTV